MENNKEGLRFYQSGKSRNFQGKAIKKMEFGSLVVIQSTALKITASRCRIVYLDSSASVSMFKSPSESTGDSYKKGSDVSVQLAAGNGSAKCIGTGNLVVGNLSINDSMHVTGLNDTLVSVGQVCDDNNIVVFTQKEAIILNLSKLSVNEEDVVAIIPRDAKTRLYCFETSNAPDLEIANSSQKVIQSGQNVAESTEEGSSTIKLWHKRLAHTNSSLLKKLKCHAEGFPKLKGKLPVCHPCRLGKATLKPFKSHFGRASYAGEVVHSDLSGPLPLSMDGSKYACTFMD